MSKITGIKPRKCLDFLRQHCKNIYENCKKQKSRTTKSINKQDFYLYFLSLKRQDIKVKKILMEHFSIGEKTTESLLKEFNIILHRFFCEKCNKTFDTDRQYIGHCSHCHYIKNK